MGNIMEGLLPSEDFKKILKAIKPVLKENTDIEQLQKDLYSIRWNALVRGEDELENSPTIAKIATFLKGMAQDIEDLVGRKDQIEKLYPAFECPETGRRSYTTPNWLSQHTDQINFIELKTIEEELRLLEKSAREEIADDKKPRLSARPYYIRELKKFYNKYSKYKASVKKYRNTRFSDFVQAYLEHGGTVLKKKTIKLGALYDEFQKLKNEE